MIRFLFRLLATFALAVATIMAVLDATRSIAADQLVLTLLTVSWSSVSPDTLDAFRLFVTEKGHPLLWDPVGVWILNQPGMFVFLAIAFLLYAIGRRRAEKIGRFAES